MLFDIFISYSHRDDEAVIANQRGWVSQLHASLETRLGQILGRTPSLWRDPRLTGFEPFDETLEERLSETKVLLCVFSPSYLNSDWCTQERDWFLESVARSTATGSPHRIFKVIKTPLSEAERAQEPEMFKPLLGYRFYDRGKDGGPPEELHQIFGTAVMLEYWLRLNKLAYEVSTVLRAFDSPAATASGVEVGTGEPSRATVYLSSATADIEPVREALRSELRRRGVRVLPDRALPPRGADLRTLLGEQLAESDLALHLVGIDRAFVPEGEDLSVSEIELELGAAARSQIVWMPRDLVPQDRQQVEFVESLRRAGRLPAGAQLLESSPEQLKGVVIDTLSERETPTVGTDGGKGSIACIYLVCDRSDLEAVEPIRDALFDRGCEVTLPALEGDERQIRLDHQETLVACDAVLLYWGNAEQLWLRRKLRELLKIRGYGRTRPMLATGVMLASPETDAKQRFRLASGLLLRADTPEEIDRFVTALEAPDERRAQ